jgi:dCTP deaminase
VILTDREIKIAIERKIILIRPAPEADAFSSTTVDLTLDEHLHEFLPGPTGGVRSVVDPMDAEFNPEETLKQVTKLQKIDQTNGYVLNKDHLVLGWTREYVELPTHARIAARVEGKSSRARFGLGVHITAPTIHAGFKGRIRLEMVNHGTYPMLLRTGMPICQLVFEQTLGTPEKGYQGIFLGQDIAEADH